jgi:hypothetical protein
LVGISRSIDRLYDALENRLESVGARRWIGSGLVAAFLVSLLAIALSRYGLLPAPLDVWVPTSFFSAIDVAFTALMLVEVLLLVLSLAHSFTSATGKQFELLSLILLRKSFKELSGLDHTFRWEDVAESALHMLSDAGGALAVFLLVVLFYRAKRAYASIADPDELQGFVTAKKLIALLMMLLFGVLLIEELLIALLYGREAVFPFFEAFYTVLIFSDVLIVLLSLRYTAGFATVFRNSGFAVATVLVRLALVAPAYLNSLLAVASAAFALLLLVIYNHAMKVSPETETTHTP